MIQNDIFKRTRFQNTYKERVKILNTKFEIPNNIELPKFKWLKQEIIVLNLEYWDFEFVSDFVLRNLDLVLCRGKVKNQYLKILGDIRLLNKKRSE